MIADQSVNVFDEASHEGVDRAVTAGCPDDRIDPHPVRDSLVFSLFLLLGTVISVWVELSGLLAEALSGHDSTFWHIAASACIPAVLCTMVFLLRRNLVLRRQAGLRGDLSGDLSGGLRTRGSVNLVEPGNDASILDPVTGLLHRQLWRQRLEQEMSRASRDGTEVALTVLDIDRFRQINDLHGHDVGDALLHVVAVRLSRLIRDMDTLLRLGADEFLIIQPGLTGRDGALSLIDRIMAATVEPIQAGSQLIATSISAGVALSPTGFKDAPALLRRAEIALSRAKQDGGATYQFFETDMGMRQRERQQFEQDLRSAIEMQALVLYYQPLFNVYDRRLLGFEALLRWYHMDKGFISPADFIPLAEETGLIMGLGEWVLEQACKDAMKWAGDVKIAVNLSPVQFRDRDLPSKIASIIERSGLPAERLELEITEGVLIEDADTALAMLVELKALGVCISMDDFGTGYSSLSYLKRFPFDKIKIDRSFVSHLESGSEDAAIVRAILAMGHSLGMIATAEGVESVEQMDYLLLEGCDEAQGFLLGRPMPFDHALALTEVPHGFSVPVAHLPWQDTAGRKRLSSG